MSRAVGRNIRRVDKIKKKVLRLGMRNIDIQIFSTGKYHRREELIFFLPFTVI